MDTGAAATAMPCPLYAGVAEPESTVPGWVMPAKIFFCEQTPDWGHRVR